MLLGSFAACAAQDSQGFEVHANPKAGAAEIGLPSYPGSTLYKDPKGDSKFDFGFTFGDTHFKVIAADYVSKDAGARILDFYRKPLSKYGEILECNHGQPVGSLTHTASGLTCMDKKGGHVQVGSTDSSTDHELRAGSPQQFRIVGIDDAHAAPTKFTLVYLELPKDESEQKK